MEWWIWLLVGLLLLLTEVLTPGGFYFLFFGIGALVTGVLAGFDMAGPVWSQWLLFSTISVVSLVLLRPHLIKLMESSDPAHQVDSLVGETCVAVEDIPVNGFGKAEMRGTAWNARNVAGHALARGERCKVERVEGLLLWIREA
jgi:membrane protein implicated in regulation of membrane protease activity